MKRPRLLPAAMIVGLLAAALPALAAEPVLSVVLPRGGQRGTEVKATLYGDRLHDAEEIFFYSPGLQALDLEVVDGKRLKARFSITSDCRLGEHALRVRTRSGISSFHTFYVGPYPTVREKEPNSLFSEPQQVSSGVTVAGVVTNEDVDYYVIEARKGERISAEVEGIRLGGEMFDPYLAILDENRFELAACDDSALLLQDPVASIAATADGRYVIEVRSSSYRGSRRCRYRLHIGAHPRPLVVYPAGGPVGETLEVRFIGDPLGDQVRKITVTDQRQRGDRTGGLFLDDDAMTPSPVAFRAVNFPNVLESEPNGNSKQATDAGSTFPVALNGIIEKDGDHDWFRFEAVKGRTYDIQVFARRVQSPLDPVLTAHDGNGQQVVGNDDSNGPDSYLRATAPESGAYFFRVRDHLGQGGPDFVYRVEIRSPSPSLALTLPQVRRYRQDRQAIAIPRGNRFATLIRATRTDFGGELTFQADGLPSGVTLHHENMASNQNVVPVVFEAAPDAPVGGTLLPFMGRHVDPKQKIQGHYFQNADLVRAEPNNTIYYQGRVDELAVAVTEEAPFRLQLVEPKVPLVRGGAMHLEIIAERAEGFDAPITLDMLYRPPGVGAARGVKIPKGKDRARLRINANGRAQLRSWKIAVIGSAPVRGPLVVSTQLATLQVAEPFLSAKIEMTAVEQGKNAEVFCQLSPRTPFEGQARAELLGLPGLCQASPVEFAHGTEEIVFNVTTDAKSPRGRHKSLFLRVHVPANGETVLHHLGGRAVLRIDPPPPPEVAKAAAPKKAKKPEAPAKKPEKRLSRLEKLRKEHADRKKEGQ